jgi:uncharacterized membrane protein YedE/YeeE
MKVLASALFGVLFGVGLLISGMTDPARVLAFLDVAGAWNPALALVMGAAVAVALPAFAVARRKSVSALGERIELPDRFRIDARLVSGAALFGLGWGLSGICPGPAIVLLGQDLSKAGVFVAAAVVGGWVAGALRARYGQIGGQVTAEQGT